MLWKKSKSRVEDVRTRSHGPSRPPYLSQKPRPYLLGFFRIMEHIPIPLGFSFSIGWTIEYENEYHFIENEYEICPEICPEMWAKMRPYLLGPFRFFKAEILEVWKSDYSGGWNAKYISINQSNRFFEAVHNSWLAVTNSDRSDRLLRDTNLLALASSPRADTATILLS